MASQREFQEMIARCVSTMVYYRNDERSPMATATMVADIQTVAAWLAPLGLSAGELGRDLFKPVEKELVARYGRPIGGCLHAEFLEAFDGSTAMHHSLGRAEGVKEY